MTKTFLRSRRLVVISPVLRKEANVKYVQQQNYQGAAFNVLGCFSALLKIRHSSIPAPVAVRVME